MAQFIPDLLVGVVMLSCPLVTPPPLQLLTRGSETATEQEIADNPRAASVRLRAAVRIRAPRGGAGRSARTHSRGDAA